MSALWESLRTVGSIMIVAVMFSFIGSALTASAEQATPSAVTSPEPEIRYTGVAEGKRDGFIVFTTPRNGAEFTIFCVDGTVAFSKTDASTLPIRPDFQAVSCEFESLLDLLPNGAVLEVNDQLHQGWIVETAPNGSETATRCWSGHKESLGMSPDGNPVYSIELGATACYPRGA